MSGPALYRPGVERDPKPDAYRQLIGQAQREGVAYSIPELSDEAHRRQGRTLAERGYTRA